MFCVVVRFECGVIDEMLFPRTCFCLVVFQHFVRPIQCVLIKVGIVKILTFPVGWLGLVVQD